MPDYILSDGQPAPWGTPRVELKDSTPPDSMHVLGEFLANTDVAELVNAFCPTGRGGGINPHCTSTTAKTARQQAREARQREYEGSVQKVRTKLGEGRIQAIKDLVKEMLPGYEHVTVYGMKMKAFTPQVPEVALVSVMVKRGIVKESARGVPQRILDGMVHIGELVRHTTGSSDPRHPRGTLVNFYSLPGTPTSHVR